MPIAYYTQTADEDHWSGVWEQQQLDHLLAIATHDPLSRHLEAHLPPSGLIFEGGCGLGQYILFFRQRGYQVFGGDFSLRALRIHRQAYPDSPLLGLDLRRLPFANGAFQGHISLGVVEHLEGGLQETLHEFYRTLAPGGILLLSVPWVNGARRLLTPFIRRRQAQRRAAGATFYQYAFTRRELGRFLTAAGFAVRAFYPYSPGKGVREVLSFLKPRTSSHVLSSYASVPARRQLQNTPFRRLLYTPPLLWTFAHMILVVAVRL